MSAAHCTGVWPAVATPFNDDYSVNEALLTAHCGQLLESGASGLSILGTTGEASSLSVAERMAVLEAVANSGIDPSLLLPGTGCSALTDTVELTRHAVDMGCAGVLLLPPFYYKAVEPEGLVAAASEVIHRVGAGGLKIYLYHIPQVSGVAWPVPVVEQLRAEFPEIVVGIKDSSGDPAHLGEITARLPGFATFPGTESLLLDALRRGGAGCVSAVANVNVAAIRELYDAWQTPGADELQARVARTRELVCRYPLIPAVKAILAARYDEPAWARVRPPLLPLADAEARQLRDAFSERAGAGAER